MKLKKNVDNFLNRTPRQTWRLIHSKIFRYHKKLDSFDNKHPCIFVLSTGRVGTETLASLCSLASNVFAYHEPVPKIYALSKLGYEYSADSVARIILGEAFNLSRVELLNYSLGNNRGYVETSPQVTFLAPIIAELIPNSRFIHLVRNPKEVVRSGMRRKWFDGNSYDVTRITPKVGTEAQRLWDCYTPFQKNLWLWAETNRWTMKFCRTVPPENVLLLRSEDVFSANSGTLERLFDFVASPLPSERKIRNVLSKKLNSQKTGGFPTSSHWDDKMNKELAALTGDIALSIGYSV